MSLLERSIISIIEPNFSILALEKLLMEDRTTSKDVSEQINGLPAGTEFMNDPSKQTGITVPWISINSMKLDQDEIGGLEIDISDKVPTLFLKFKDSKNRIAMDAPLDAAIVSVYIKPPDEENQRPIRMDFNIVSFDGNPKSRTYICRGILRLPKFYSEVCQSFKSASSFDHLKKMCQDLGIGYASNEDNTVDVMTRFIPFENYEFFVNETVETSYKDDDSFFDWYIDPWYYLCLVNVNKQFDLEDEFEEINISNWPPVSSMQGGKGMDSHKASFMLSTGHPHATTNLGIEAYNMVNTSGDVSIKNGYQRTGQWLNIDGKVIKPEQAFSEALTTPGAENDFILLKGRKQDDGTLFDYREWKKYSWLGKQSSNANEGNVHDNYAFAKILNHQNLEELRKTSLVVNMRGINFYVYKYQKIPVSIYESGTEDNKANMANRNRLLGEENPDPEPGSEQEKLVGTGSPVSDPTQMVLNKFLSGYYVVGGIKYTWSKNPGYMQQQVTLIRREWPIPSKNNTP